MFALVFKPGIDLKTAENPECELYSQKFSFTQYITTKKGMSKRTVWFQLFGSVLLGRQLDVYSVKYFYSM